MSENTIISPDAAPDVLPVPLQAPGFAGMLAQMKNGRFLGWVHAGDDDAPVNVSLFEGEACLLTFKAELWNEEMATLRGGKGYCGFEFDIPQALCDGRVHTVDFRITDSIQSLVARPVRVLPGRRPPERNVANHAFTASANASATGESAAYPIKLSIIVNFYNMHREAARTLTSLGRAYQQGIEGLAYEVLCIDNGSTPPLDPEWIASFGPEFRLVRPSKLLPSPCAALNEAASQARGQYLAIMMDGAHVLTPGVMAEALAAFAESPGCVVALRYWFVGGDQRWLHAAGYSREMEDKIFARIHWPANGYKLFEAGAPILESPTSWFDHMIESNCLFLPAELYGRIGGVDENFSEPGGGFANLDLFRRATTTAEGGVVSLIGEASFHQYHEGTTTNVSTDEKDARVRAYASAYRELKGNDYEVVNRLSIRSRGSIKLNAAVRTMKDSFFPMGVAVTAQVRPCRPNQHFDGGSRRYLQTKYAECGLHQQALWRGAPVGVAPADLLNFQEIIRLTEPDCIVTTSADHGLLMFLDDVLTMYGCEHARIVRVSGVAPRGPMPARLRTIIGNHTAPKTLAGIEEQIATCDTVLVLYAPTSGVSHPLDAMRAYSKFVTPRSYLIFLGSVFGQPWLGYSKHWYLASIKQLVASSSFAVEAVWEQQLLTTCASGYLRRIDTPGAYDATLDQLDIFESANA